MDIFNRLRSLVGLGPVRLERLSANHWRSIVDRLHPEWVLKTKTNFEIFKAIKVALERNLKISLNHIQISALLANNKTSIANLAEILLQIAKAYKDIGEGSSISSKDSILKEEIIFAPNSSSDDNNSNKEIIFASISSVGLGSSFDLEDDYLNDSISDFNNNKPSDIVDDSGTWFTKNKPIAQNRRSELVDDIDSLHNINYKRRGDQSFPDRAYIKKARSSLSSNDNHERLTPRRVLRPISTDTPHTKALRLRRLRLMSEKAALERDQIGLQTDPRSSVSFDSNDDDKVLSGSSIFHHELDDDEKSNNTPVLSLPERNFNKFQANIRKQMPYLTNIDPYITKKTFDGQIGIWKKALDDRLWSRAVVNQKKKVERNDRIKSARLLQKDLEKSKEVIQKMDSKAEILKVTKQLEERNRRLIRMTVRKNDVKQEVNNLLKKRRLENEKILLRTHDKFLKAQRDEIIQSRIYIKDFQVKKDKEEKLKKKSRENFLKDQIKLLEEELQDVKKNEKIVEKARQEEIRRYNAEQKINSKNQIRKFKEKLEVDLDASNYHERDLEKLNQNDFFNLKKK